MKSLGDPFATFPSRDEPQGKSVAEGCLIEQEFDDQRGGNSFALRWVSGFSSAEGTVVQLRVVKPSLNSPLEEEKGDSGIVGRTRSDIPPTPGPRNCNTYVRDVTADWFMTSNEDATCEHEVLQANGGWSRGGFTGPLGCFPSFSWQPDPN